MHQSVWAYLPVEARLREGADLGRDARGKFRKRFPKNPQERVVAFLRRDVLGKPLLITIIGCLILGKVESIFFTADNLDPKAAGRVSLPVRHIPGPKIGNCLKLQGQNKFSGSCEKTGPQPPAPSSSGDFAWLLYTYRADLGLPLPAARKAPGAASRPASAPLQLHGKPLTGRL